MRASPFAVLPALSTLITLISSSGTVTPDRADDFCITISEETEFRWSKEHLAFLTLYPNRDGDSLAQWEPGGNKSLLCVQAPENHHIVLHISLNISDENASSTEHNSTCDPHYPHECKATCLSVRESEQMTDNKSDYGAIDSSVFEVLRDISFEFLTLNYTQRKSAANVSKVDEHLERFPRFSLPPFNTSSHEASSSSRKFGKRGTRGKGNKGYRCKFSSKGAHRRRSKRTRRKIKWKSIAAELLKDYYERWLIDQEDAAKLRESGDTGRKSISAESKEARDCIRQFIIASRRRRKPRATEPLQQTPSSIPKSLQRLPQEVIETPIKTKRSGERWKRLAMKSTTTSPSNENSLIQLSNFSFCGPGPSWSNLRTSEKDLSNLIQWEFPLFLHSSGQEMRIRIPHLLPADDPLLAVLKIKVSFFAEEKKKAEDVEVAITNSHSNGNVTPTRILELLSPSVTGNDINANESTIAGDLNPADSNDNVHIIIGVAFGSLLVFVSAVFCLFCLHRKKKNALCEAKKRRRDLVNEGETEKCLASVENCEPRTDYISMRHQEGRRDLTEVNERRMQEHKKHKHSHRKAGKAKRQDDVTDPRKAHETKQQQQSRQHVTQCKHLLSMRGLSRHEHCIVCQIAGKPHQPIMNAQYASEFLPPASRHNNNSGFSSSPQDNFDKFNRLQNNPYRHSPSMTPKSVASLPWTIKLPDGEERYRSRRDFKLQGEVYRDPISVCVKAPPNRTIFGNEPLPFGAPSRQKHSGKVNGYPGPPTSVSRSATFERSVDREGQPRTEAPREDCICRYIMNHIDEPPPEYSDVIKEDPLSSEAEDSDSNTRYPDLGSQKRDDSNSLPNT